MQYDFLKYWRVVRRYVLQKYGLHSADLDMILFLYSERYFDAGKFAEYDNILRWDEQRFYRLVEEGWIETFRPKTKAKKAIYKLTMKSNRMCGAMYSKLVGDEPIPMSAASNKMFKKNACFRDKTVRMIIRKMNQELKEKRFDEFSDI